MIERRTLEHRAGELGITIRHAEMDYVLQHLLAGFARDPDGSIFRGGTALARVYWPDFRISEDLDFVATADSPAFESRATGVVAAAADEMGLDATLDIGGWRDNRLRATVTWTNGWTPGGELLVDVVRGQGNALPTTSLPLDLSYPDLEGAPAAVIEVLQLPEILANKWLMLDDRDEPRDLFDLWWGLSRGGVGFEVIADAHRVAIGYPPMPASIESAARLEHRWEQRLAHQTHDLPSFRVALEEVRRHFDGWRSSEAHDSQPFG